MSELLSSTEKVRDELKKRLSMLVKELAWPRAAFENLH